jgi:hypothetical protein
MAMQPKQAICRMSYRTRSAVMVFVITIVVDRDGREAQNKNKTRATRHERDKDNKRERRALVCKGIEGNGFTPLSHLLSLLAAWLLGLHG